MLDGRQYTKQQVSIGTGLSAAACNTLLNDMQMQDIVIGGSKQSGEVGRHSVLYQIRDDHECYLAIYFAVEKGNKTIGTIVFSAAGKILSQERKRYELVDHRQVQKIIDTMIKAYPNLAQIIVGTPSITEPGIIKHFDIPELENISLKTDLEKCFGLPVAVENDMHHKAYGYCRKTNNEDEVITLAYYPSHVLSGTVTIHKGTIIKGANGFAGMTVFLPYDVDRMEQIAMLGPQSCMPFIAKSVIAIIVLQNPGTIVLTGDLINEIMVEKLKKICMEDIPQEYMPQFLRVDDLNEYYYEGMYQLAVDRKEI